MVYNLTNITAGNESTFLTFTQGVNDTLMFGWMGALILIGLFVVLFTSFFFTTQDLKKTLVGSMFICFVLSLSLRALDLLPNLGIFITLILLAISLAITWKS